MAYTLQWITDQLAVGYAPMFDVDLDMLKQNGIDAIVNLCGEFCDLHEIQMESGFEVHYVPVPDECAPDVNAMETAFEWLDNTLSQGRKVLVHCRFGVGRTGTFVTAYLLTKGLNMKAATKALQHTRANPTHHCQWKMLKQYQRKLKKV